MKVLFDSHMPFLLAHGGVQIQIEQTRIALAKAWEWRLNRCVGGRTSSRPTFCIFLGECRKRIWCVSRREKGMKVVLQRPFTEQGSRPAWRRTLEGTARRAIMRAFPGPLLDPCHWDSYRSANALVALTPWAAHVIAELFGADPRKIHVVPNGVEAEFLNSQAAQRGPWLVCTATITEARKRVLQLAGGRGARCDAALDHRQTVFRDGALRPTFSNSGAAKSRDSPLRRSDQRPGRAGTDISGGARVRFIERDGKPEPVGARGCGVPMSTVIGRPALGPAVLQTGRGLLRDHRRPARPPPPCARFTTGHHRPRSPPMPLSWPEVARQLKSLYEAVSRPAS